jgi:hypothetical protein
MEMKAPTARKGENRFDDFCSGVFEPALRLGEVIGIKDHQWSARINRVTFGESAG